MYGKKIPIKEVMESPLRTVLFTIHRVGGSQVLAGVLVSELHSVAEAAQAHTVLCKARSARCVEK